MDHKISVWATEKGMDHKISGSATEKGMDHRISSMATEKGTDHKISGSATKNERITNFSTWQPKKARAQTFPAWQPKKKAGYNPAQSSAICRNYDQAHCAWLHYSESSPFSCFDSPKMYWTAASALADAQTINLGSFCICCIQLAIYAA